MSVLRSSSPKRALGFDIHPRWDLESRPPLEPRRVHRSWADVGWVELGEARGYFDKGWAKLGQLQPEVSRMWQTMATSRLSSTKCGQLRKLRVWILPSRGRIRLKYAPYSANTGLDREFDQCSQVDMPIIGRAWAWATHERRRAPGELLERMVQRSWLPMPTGSGLSHQYMYPSIYRSLSPFSRSLTHASRHTRAAFPLRNPKPQTSKAPSCSSCVRQAPPCSRSDTDAPHTSGLGDADRGGENKATRKLSETCPSLRPGSNPARSELICRARADAGHVWPHFVQFRPN